MTYSMLSHADPHSILAADETIAFSASVLTVLSRSKLPVLLQGERGVGKKLLARALHDQSVGRAAPFVTVQCAGTTAEALARELFGHVSELNSTPGKIEASRGGTLYIEDIDQMPDEIERALLAVLASGELNPVGGPIARAADLRLIASRTSELFADVGETGRDGESYRRIRWRKVLVPPLRARGRELALLVEDLAREAAREIAVPEKSFAPDVLEALAQYDWPGNLHELREVVRKAVHTSAEVIELDTLPSTVVAAYNAEPEQDAAGELAGLELAEYRAICDCLRSNRGNLTRTARELRIARSTLYAKLKKYGLEEGLGGLRLRAESGSAAMLHA
jgi:DNA-binding NtrC family response regulator